MSYPAPISQRHEQKERTRTRIVDAALAVIREGGEDMLTMGSVALAAGITQRTVFRYFATRDDLIQSAWQRMLELIGTERVPESADEIIERPRRVFPRLAQERELVRAYIYSRARREARMRPNERRQQAIVKAVRGELEFLDERSQRRRAAIVQVISSPYAWEVMRESWGFSGAEAGKAAAEAMQILLGHRLPE